MKERLTQWVNNGASLILDNPKNELEARQQLMEKYKQACIKLAEYEDLEEQGLIVRLPCKVGDTVYIAVLGAKKVYTEKVNHIEIVPKAILVNDMTFGEVVFLTLAEAEKKLKELKGEE